MIPTEEIEATILGVPTEIRVERNGTPLARGLDFRVADARMARRLLPDWPQTNEQLARSYVFRGRTEHRDADLRLALADFCGEFLAHTTEKVRPFAVPGTVATCG